MKRFLITAFELFLVGTAVIVWVHGVSYRTDFGLVDQPEQSDPPISISEREMRIPEQTIVPGPIALARWFGELPPAPPVVAPEPVPEPEVEAPTIEEPEIPEPEEAPYIRISGTLTIEGRRLISAIDSRSGRAVLIGDSTDLADWILIEELPDGLIVNADGRRLRIAREER